MTTRIALAAALGALAVGCSSGGGKSGNGCQMDWAATCIAFEGFTSDMIAEVKASCAEQGGAWVSGCPGANRVGVCTIYSESGEMSMATVFYPGAACDANEVAAQCAYGSFTPGTATCGAEAPVALTCDERAVVDVGTCTEVSGLAAPERVDTLESICTHLGGALGSGACPAVGLSGTCHDAIGNLIGDIHHYDWANAAQDQADCVVDGGTWIPGAL